MISSKVIEITNSDEGVEYTFKAFEFENGVVLIPGDTSCDWFFDSREKYQPNGLDKVVEITDTDDTKEFSIDELKEIIKGSESEFDYKAGEKVLALCASRNDQYI